MLYKIRPVEHDDVPFIINSWLRSYWKATAHNQGIAKNAYYTYHHKLVEKAVKDELIFVAVNTHDSEQIFGWCCFKDQYEMHILHYIYVKQPFRRFGIAQALLNSIGSLDIITHKTEMGDLLSETFYNPYIFYEL